MKMIMEFMNNFIDTVSGVLYQPWCVPLLLLVGGIILTIRSKLMQARLFTECFKVITEKPTTKGGISSFGALMVSTASRVGTGNIIGVATAICAGGRALYSGCGSPRSSAVHLLSWNLRWLRSTRKEMRMGRATAVLPSI